MSQTAALYHLQTLDSQIDTIRKRLDEIARLLSQDDVLQAAQIALTNAEQSHIKWHARQTELELERASVQEEVKDTETRLYSGKISNPRELTDLQDKLAELNRRSESLEEPILEAMLAVEADTTTVEQAQKALDRVVNERSHQFGELDKEQTTFSEQLTQLLAETEQERSHINIQHLEIYDQLRQRPGGLAVTLLKGDECGVCGVELTSQMAQRVRRGDVLTCPTCNRILHVQ
ncbi:MAG: hypothetical protein JXB07_04785 [Anaerolineae bacterium]|nr:hypothetical protein [Anaerolineae bacterium]